MSAAKRNTETNGGKTPVDSEEDFRYEEVPLEGDWSLTEGEEDLEATLKAIQIRGTDAQPVAASNGWQPEALDDFLRNFLLRAGMTRTLECFQAERRETKQKWLVDMGRVVAVPGVYADNQRLDAELKHAQRERDEYRREASTLAQALVKAQRVSDLQWLQLRRLAQEKARLVEENRKLKVQCDSYEPLLQKMADTYKSSLKTFQRGTR